MLPASAIQTACHRSARIRFDRKAVENGIVREDDNLSNEEILNLRGKVIPIFRLHEHFQIPEAVTDPRKATIVVVETEGRPFGLLVDDMISKQEVVIKSLGSMMQNIKGVSGGTIPGDGDIALILDPASLINAA